MRAGRFTHTLTTVVLTVACLALTMLAFGLLSGRFRVLPVLSGSMEPMISAGDLAVAAPKPTGSVRTGDVIVFHPPGEDHLVVHRVVSVVSAEGGPVIRTKGDDNAKPDRWNAELNGETAWEVRRVIPKLGHVAVLAKQPNARLIAIAGAALVFLLVTLHSIWTKNETKDEGSEHAVAVA